MLEEATHFYPLGTCWWPPWLCHNPQNDTAASSLSTWIKDKPQSTDPPKISPWVSNKGGIELIKSVHRGRLKTISKAILPRWQLGVMVLVPHIWPQVSQSMALFVGLCNQTARRAGAAGLRNKWSQTLKCHLPLHQMHHLHLSFLLQTGFCSPGNLAAKSALHLPPEWSCTFLLLSGWKF